MAVLVWRRRRLPFDRWAGSSQGTLMAAGSASRHDPRHGTPNLAVNGELAAPQFREAAVAECAAVGFSLLGIRCRPSPLAPRAAGSPCSPQWAGAARGNPRHRFPIPRRCLAPGADDAQAEAGDPAASPAEKLIPPERERLQPRVLSEAEYKRLLAAVHGEIRDEAIIELLLQTGIRLAELARLKVSDIELPAKVDREHTGAVHIHGKGRKERTVTLNYKACRAIRNYLQVRPKVEAPQ